MTPTEKSKLREVRNLLEVGLGKPMKEVSSQVREAIEILDQLGVTDK